MLNLMFVFPQNADGIYLFSKKYAGVPKIPALNFVVLLSLACICLVNASAHTVYEW